MDNLTMNTSHDSKFRGSYRSCPDHTQLHAIHYDTKKKALWQYHLPALEDDMQLLSRPVHTVYYTVVPKVENPADCVTCSHLAWIEFEIATVDRDTDVQRSLVQRR